jgi:hypothetical protein
MGRVPDRAKAGAGVGWRTMDADVLIELECEICGYGIACATAPERCPMCQSEDAWIDRPWRPFSRQRDEQRATRLQR